MSERPTGGLNHRAWMLLAGVTLLALAVRLWGIGFGLPSLYHSDEPKYVLIAAPHTSNLSVATTALVRNACRTPVVVVRTP